MTRPLSAQRLGSIERKTHSSLPAGKNAQPKSVLSYRSAKAQSGGQLGLQRHRPCLLASGRDNRMMPCASTRRGITCRSRRYMGTKQTRSDLPQGTLDLLILKIVALGPDHGYSISQRL